MKKIYSLKGRLCFKSVYLQGLKLRRRSFTAFYLKDCSKKKEMCSTKGSGGKLGIVVTKRLGKAHDRNKAKRRFKAAFYQSVQSMEFDMCIIFRLQNDFLNIELDKVKQDILYFFNRVGILEKSEK